MQNHYKNCIHKIDVLFWNSLKSEWNQVKFNEKINNSSRIFKQFLSIKEETKPCKKSSER